MPENKQRNVNLIEQEFTKRLDQFDRRFDRNGWFFLVIVILIFFIMLYLFMTLFRVSEVDTYTSNADISAQIEELEIRIESLENELDIQAGIFQEELDERTESFDERLSNQDPGSIEDEVTP